MVGHRRRALAGPALPGLLRPVCLSVRLDEADHALRVGRERALDQDLVLLKPGESTARRPKGQQSVIRLEVVELDEHVGHCPLTSL